NIKAAGSGVKHIEEAIGGIAGVECESEQAFLIANVCVVAGGLDPAGNVHENRPGWRGQVRDDHNAASFLNDKKPVRFARWGSDNDRIRKGQPGKGVNQGIAGGSKCFSARKRKNKKRHPQGNKDFSHSETRAKLSSRERVTQMGWMTH